MGGVKRLTEPTQLVKLRYQARRDTRKVYCTAISGVYEKDHCLSYSNTVTFIASSLSCQEVDEKWRLYLFYFAYNGKAPIKPFKTLFCKSISTHFI